MKILFGAILFLMISAQAFSQDMKTKKVMAPKKKIPAELLAVLKSDKTNTHPYISGQYYCHNFATQLYMQNSCLLRDLEAFDISAIESEWGTIISRLAESSKLPIFYVSLSNKESGFYHAINAYIVNPAKPEDIASYIFIEPQSDETYLTAKNLYDEYRHYYDKSPEVLEILHVTISKVESVKKNSAGTLQTMTTDLQAFDVQFR